MLIFVLSEFDELQVKGATNEKLQLNERKIVQVECKEVYFNLPRRSLSYVKIVQVECKDVYFNLPRRSLSYVKIV